VSSSGDRRYAGVAEGDMPNGLLWLYDFNEKNLRLIGPVGGRNHEIACSADARYFARSHGGGCEVLDAKGGRLGNFAGKAVIAAAFHPKAHRVFLLRDGETNIQEYSVPDLTLVNEYPMDKAVSIHREVKNQVVANVTQTGNNSAVGTVRRVRSVSFRAFESGRVRVSDNGDTVCAVVPTGVYVFATKEPAAKEEGSKFKVIEAK
jgi:hypothetical protein